MSFLLKSDLPKKTQVEIDRIQAISSGQRTSEESGFLDSLAPYLTNAVQEYDADLNITRCSGETVPTDGETGFAPGCIFVDLSGSIAVTYQNFGTESSCNFELAGGDIRTEVVEIASDAITGTDAGELGHADGVELVAAPGSGKVIELISAVLSYVYDTAAYTDGGNTTINWVGGAAITGLVSAANGIGASADKIVGFQPLAAAGNAMVEDSAINLEAASAFTQPGTAAGTIKVIVTYRIITL